MIKNWSAALTLSVVLLASAGVARAGDPNAEKARAHFQQGDTYFKLEKYANALQEFEQAYLAKQDPSFLYNIAQCHRLMGNRVEAVRFYKRYLNDAPNAANRPVAEKHIRDLESALGAEELTGAHPAPPPASGPANAPGGPGPAMPPPTTDRHRQPVALGGAGAACRVRHDADVAAAPRQRTSIRSTLSGGFGRAPGPLSLAGCFSCC